MKIEVTISPKGQTKIETKGFAGAECQEASKFMEQALGQQTGEQLTAEFHQHVTSDQVQHEQT